MLTLINLVAYSYCTGMGGSRGIPHSSFGIALILGNMNRLGLFAFFRVMLHVDVVVIVYAEDKKMFLFNNILKKTGNIVQM